MLKLRSMGVRGRIVMALVVAGPACGAGPCPERDDRFDPDVPPAGPGVDVCSLPCSDGRLLGEADGHYLIQCTDDLCVDGFEWDHVCAVQTEFTAWTAESCPGCRVRHPRQGDAGVEPRVCPSTYYEIDVRCEPE